MAMETFKSHKTQLKNNGRLITNFTLRFFIFSKLDFFPILETNQIDTDTTPPPNLHAKATIR